jgi:hypothetical protein
MKTLPCKGRMSEEESNSWSGIQIQDSDGEDRWWSRGQCGRGRAAAGVSTLHRTADSRRR